MLVLGPDDGAGSSTHCNSKSDAIQPAGQRILSADRSRLACQYKKGCLKGILGILLTPQHASANPKHHLFVSANQQLKRGFVSAEEKPIKQLSIRGRPTCGWSDHSAQVPQKCWQLISGHNSSLSDRITSVAGFLTS
jgi:hypothetical protein